MTLGLILLGLFLLFYAALSVAIIVHVETYSFSRSARWMVGIFIAFAILFAAMAIIFFFKVDWFEIINFYTYHA